MVLNYVYNVLLVKNVWTKKINQTQNVETDSQKSGLKMEKCYRMLTSHNDSICHQEAANKTIHYNHIISSEKKDIYASLRPLVCLGNIGTQATPVVSLSSQRYVTCSLHIDNNHSLTHSSHRRSWHGPPPFF